MKTEERNPAFKKKQNEPKYLQEWTSRVKKMGSSQSGQESFWNSLAMLILILYNMVKKTSMVKPDHVEKEGKAMQVNILEAKTNLSNLVRLIETGKEERIIIARYGKPVVKMVVYNDAPVSKRIGVAKGKLKSPVDLDRHNDEIAELFGGAL